MAGERSAVTAQVVSWRLLRGFLLPYLRVSRDTIRGNYELGRFYQR